MTYYGGKNPFRAGKCSLEDEEQNRRALQQLFIDLGSPVPGVADDGVAGSGITSSVTGEKTPTVEPVRGFVRFKLTSDMSGFEASAVTMGPKWGDYGEAITVLDTLRRFPDELNGTHGIAQLVVKVIEVDPEVTEITYEIVSLGGKPTSTTADHKVNFRYSDWDEGIEVGDDPRYFRNHFGVVLEVNSVTGVETEVVEGDSPRESLIDTETEQWVYPVFEAVDTGGFTYSPRLYFKTVKVAGATTFIAPTSGASVNAAVYDSGNPSHQVVNYNAAGNFWWVDQSSEDVKAAIFPGGTGYSLARQITAVPSATPVAGTLATIGGFLAGGVGRAEMAVGGEEYDYVRLTYTSGESSSRSGDVTGATDADPIIITTSEFHGLDTGSRVDIVGVVGNLAANVSDNPVTLIDETSFSLNGVAGSGDYDSGGVWEESDPSVAVVMTGLAPATNNIHRGRTKVGGGHLAADNLTLGRAEVEVLNGEDPPTVGITVFAHVWAHRVPEDNHPVIISKDRDNAWWVIWYGCDEIV